MRFLTLNDVSMYIKWYNSKMQMVEFSLIPAMKKPHYVEGVTENIAFTRPHNKPFYEIKYIR